MSKLTVTAAPHIHSGASTNRIMLDVIVALLPATVASVVIFGLQSLVIIAACVISAVASESLFDLATGKKNTIGDFSAVVTGLLLALNLSTNVPVWQCVVGSVFAIVCVKCFFGGLGCNFANPAIAGRVFMLLTFSQVAGGLWSTSRQCRIKSASGLPPYISRSSVSCSGSCFPAFRRLTVIISILSSKKAPGDRGLCHKNAGRRLSARGGGCRFEGVDNSLSLRPHGRHNGLSLLVVINAGL